ncbi:MAG: exodeoxyribonuclease VII large subunit [Lachnospiraceae bacterium]|nr:exodeoxyribonuclease VII large subunit [Lachnospiraceae bacterium]
MKNVYSVAQVNSYIKNMFAQDFLLASIYIKGEVSNCKYHSSGHIYFTLKDQKGTLACVMFAGNRAGLKFQMQEGQQIIVGGSIDVYERDGKYQMYARTITLDGAGLLYERFQKLKEELSEMGMFAAEYKRPIPTYCKRLGVVTAPTGAAVQDIINIAGRRNPYLQIILYPAIVQGDQAAESIIKGIHALEHVGVDAMIVGRGGGSIEDLWAFNERAVAQAIFECEIPIISAVGHETDTTIADYVADLRAPTPSAAAELAVQDVRELQRKLEDYRINLMRLFENRIERYKSRMEQYRLKLQLLSPVSQIREKRTLAMQLEGHLQDSMKQILLKKRHQLEIYIEQLKGLSPLDKLNQGFSYASDDRGKTVTDVDQVIIGQQVHIQLKNGELLTKVMEKHQISREYS